MSEVKEIAQFEEEQAFFNSLPKPEGKTITIIPPEEYNVPQELDLSKFPEDEHFYVKEAFGFVREYLKLPIISDNFSRPEREKWIADTFADIEKSKGIDSAKKFKTTFKMNKLASNRIYSLVGSISLFDGYLQKNERADMQAIIDYSYDVNERELKGELGGPVTQAMLEARKKEVDDLSKHAVAILNKFAK